MAAAINAPGTVLLKSLIEFICPIVATKFPPSSDSQQGPADYGPTAIRLCESDEGQKLVKALEKFVRRIIEVQDTSLYTQGTVIDTNRDKEHDIHYSGQATGQVDSIDEISFTNTEELLRSLELPVVDQKLASLSAVNEMVYQHVFNKMPIRMLVFNSQGTDIQLVERKAVTAHIISRIQDKYPDGVPHSRVEEISREFGKYAILSHTWIRDTPGDIVYRDWERHQFTSHSAGNAKITNFCKAAAIEHGVYFGWMDTVCINKDSSSELDESIRSMYKWYRGAHVCVTYLADTLMIEETHHDSWFTRGWTLQELLAPRIVRFYNRDWKPLVPLGSFTVDDRKFRRHYVPSLYSPIDLPLELQYQIFRATTITRHELHIFHDDTQMVSLSRIMQLAAHRKVTREEDSVYSLMGLLDVGISIAYGEGASSALRRIIREIMASRQMFMDLFQHDNENTIIPQRISDYLNCSSIFNGGHTGNLGLFQPQDPLALTHKGIRLTLLAVPAFRRDIYKRLIPSDSQTCIFSLSSIVAGNADYILLDDSMHSANWATGLVTHRRDRLPTHYPPVIFMAMLSSIVYTHSCKFLATTGLCVTMNSAVLHDYGPQKLMDMEPLYQMSGPMTISLPYGSTLVQKTISLDDAKRLGMKVITKDFL